MREIEIKARVSDKEYVAEQLQKMGATFDKPVRQHDVVYIKRRALNAKMQKAQSDTPNLMTLRIRIENDEIALLTFKRPVTGQLDCIEHETQIDNPDELTAIIKELGFALYSDLTKTRTKCRLGDIEICLDELPKLGSFIEAEKMMHKAADHDAVVQELWALFSKLGILESDAIHDGYDVLERRLRGVEV